MALVPFGAENRQPTQARLSTEPLFDADVLVGCVGRFGLSPAPLFGG